MYNGKASRLRQLGHWEDVDTSRSWFDLWRRGSDRDRGYSVRIAWRTGASTGVGLVPSITVCGTLCWARELWAAC